MNTRIILVGGFLGAGKTSLLWESARLLTQEGKKVGLITNDQASELVDTEFLQKEGDRVSEVSGSCFCCNYNGFIDAIKHLTEKKQAEIIIAEPVGSCTDLSATILQPLKHQFYDQFVVAPLTVLVDPEKLSIILDTKESLLHQSAVYIIQKQMEEADIIAINKSDQLTPEEIKSLKQRTEKMFPFATVFTLSVKNGKSLDPWLKDVMNRVDAGTHLATVDYDIYAEGEAVLGWLNASFSLEGHQIVWDDYVRKLLLSLSQQFDQEKIAVGHLKLILTTGNKYIVGNVTGKVNSLNLRGSAGIGDKAKLILNARVQMKESTLKRIVLDEIAKASLEDIRVLTISLKSLTPGRPNPTHRFKQVV